MSTQTPGPWKSSQGYKVSRYTHPLHEGQTRYSITHTPSDQRLPDIAIAEVCSEQNADCIVRACNAHEELVSALKGLLAWHQAGCDPSRKALLAAEEVLAKVERYNTVIAKAEGRA